MELDEHKQSLLRLPEVIKRTGLSRSTIYAYIDKGDFPKPVKIGLRAVAWHEVKIDSWIKSRVA
ncbi:MAG: AlpA family transcriptional regulator [Alphaproteobacteria bacterium]|nr:AlpA family transcriptional regulator [Alphaproteobacteria bacterium]NCQ88938.1 AlpA family transcriptional regulator [Alphaproteobacteria bacterium]NCT07840.1 AlpA family transcriptional regulator [Alphaproteobacteria bacterium]